MQLFSVRDNAVGIGEYVFALLISALPLSVSALLPIQLPIFGWPPFAAPAFFLTVVVRLLFCVDVVPSSSFVDGRAMTGDMTLANKRKVQTEAHNGITCGESLFATSWLALIGFVVQ